MNPSLRIDVLLSGAALCASLAGIVALDMTADAQTQSLIRLFCLLGVSLQLVALVLGLTWAVGGSLIPLLFAAGLGAAGGDATPTLMWAVVGCCWFISVELAWEAIDRRDGIPRAPSVSRARVRDVAIVVGLALATTFVAVLGSAAPPVRTLPLQALAMLVFCVLVVQAARRFTRS